MADITDPRVIAFCNDRIRRLAYIARQLKAEVSEMNVKWSSEIKDLLPDNPNDPNSKDPNSPILDGREAEGISQLSCKDVGDLVYALTTMVGGLVDATVEKPCVRPLITGSIITTSEV